MSLFEREENNISFENLNVFISPNGVIGGKDKEDDTEYILSSETANFEQVMEGEGYDRKWAKCSKDEFIKRQEEIKNEIKKNEEIKKNKYLPLFSEPCIEMLDIHKSSEMNDELYGQDIEDDIYVLNKDGIFYPEEYYSWKNENDEEVPAFLAYETKAKLLKERKDKCKGNKEIEEQFEMEKYDFYSSKDEDLVAVDKKDNEKIYMLSIESATFYLPNLKKSEKLLKSKKWRGISKEEAVFLIEKQNDNIRIREEKEEDNTSKLSSPEWWDDPDDYYYGEDTNKIDYKLQ